jgi:hypothetical protein
MKLEAAAATHAGEGAAPAARDVDAEIAAVFPSFPTLARLAGFAGLVRSLRTAESLFHSTGGAKDADLSPPITLWMKVLENYVHAWLGPRLAGLQREPAALFDYVDRALGSGWPGYQRWLEPRWRDPAEVGGARDAPRERRQRHARGVPAQLRRVRGSSRARLKSCPKIARRAEGEWRSGAATMPVRGAGRARLNLKTCPELVHGIRAMRRDAVAGRE